jgi:hypothetical protein
LNATIAATLACALLLSVAGQGVGATFLTPDATVSQSDDGTVIISEPNVEWWDIWGASTGYVLEEERTIPMNDDDSWRMDYQIEEDWHRNKPGAFERYIGVTMKCFDDTGATGDQNVDEQTDTVDVLLTANNGQELLVEGIECDGSTVTLEIQHQDIQQMFEWWDEVSYDSDDEMAVWFHSEESVNDAIDNAPIIEWLQPISVELFSDTKGETLGQNMDDDLEVEIGSIDVRLAYWEAEFWGMSPESTIPHKHYESEE